VEKKRMKAVRERKHRLLMLRRAVRRKASTLWRTGLMPSARHGAGVSGLADAPLREMRSLAAVLNGRSNKRHVGVTAYLLTHPSEEYDPVYHATLDLVLNYAAWVWDGRTSPSRLQRAWTALHERAVPISWADAKGPLAATWLTLKRLAWDMKAPHILQGDLGSQYDLHRVRPADLRPFLMQGVQRWQHDRFTSHMYAHAGAPIWRRGLRYAVKGVRAARQLGALQALWSDNIPMPIRRDMKLG
ncbi:unnamed protein product, partial [Prorocentrum cordatum]